MDVRPDGHPKAGNGVGGDVLPVSEGLRCSSIQEDEPHQILSYREARMQSRGHAVCREEVKPPSEHERRRQWPRVEQLRDGLRDALGSADGRIAGRGRIGEILEVRDRDVVEVQHMAERLQDGT